MTNEELFAEYVIAKEEFIKWKEELRIWVSRGHKKVDFPLWAQFKAAKQARDEAWTGVRFGTPEEEEEIW